MAAVSIKDMLISAQAAEKAGDTAGAVSLYRGILTRMPKHSKAKKALAKLERAGGARPRMTQAEANQLLSALNSGNFEAVVAVADALGRQFREEAFVFNIKGLAQTQMGQHEDAVQSYRWAIKLDPNFVEAYGNLGALYLQMGREDVAEQTLRKALAKRKDYPEAHHNLGAALAARGEDGAALDHFNKAIAAKADYGNALNSRGSLLRSLGNTAAAIDDLRAAARLMPDDASVWSKLAGTYADAGRIDETLEANARAMKLEPGAVNHLLDRALYLNEAGRAAAAAQAFRDYLEIRPEDAFALRVALDLFDGEERAALVARIETLLDRPDVPPADVVQLGFALGQHHDRARRADLAAPRLARANAANLGLLDPPPETDDQKFARIRRLFENGAFDHLKGRGDPDARPVFVVGMMRSGTTLVEQIIASHSQAHGAGELRAATNLAQPLLEAGRKATARQLTTFCDGYLDQLTAHAGDALRVVDKMPGNFFNVGLLRIAFPKAHVINTVRDPRDVCLSIWKNFFDTHAHQYAYDQAALARFANSYKRMMNLWDDLFPGAVHHIRYEALVADQEAESRALIAHLGLDWEDAVLDFHKTRRAVRTASVNQVRQKVYSSSVKSWQAYADHLPVLFGGLDAALWKDEMAG